MKKRLMLATLPTALALALYGCGGGSSSDSSSTLRASAGPVTFPPAPLPGSEVSLSMGSN